MPSPEPKLVWNEDVPILEDLVESLLEICSASFPRVGRSDGEVAAAGRWVGAKFFYWDDDSMFPHEGEVVELKTLVEKDSNIVRVDDG